MDGNGRIGRFLMNAMLASGGYPWTIVPLNKRNQYMSALEQASTNQNITPLCQIPSSIGSCRNTRRASTGYSLNRIKLRHPAHP
jgi:hypothetical protein